MRQRSGWLTAEFAARRGSVFVAVFLVLGACAGGTEPTEVAQRQAPPPADFRTQAEQFADLQEAALAADYLSFARFLGARDEQALVAQLTESFGGAAFDIYTADAATDSWMHRRLVELRGPSDRLYLLTALSRAPGGWNIAGYELGRDRGSIAPGL